MQAKRFAAPWMGRVLMAAGIYNLLFGAFAVFFPNLYFSLAGMEAPLYPQLWQCIGMIVGVYGIGYLVASTKPLTHWPIVLVGLLGKIFGPIGFVQAVATGAFSLAAGWMIVFNDLIWIVPFFLILRAAYRRTKFQDYALLEMMNNELSHIQLSDFDTSEDIDLMEMTNRWPTLLVFLRHFGCTFCREALADLAEVRAGIEVKGTRIVVAHMLENENEAAQELKKYGLGSLPHISDPESLLYKKFELRRGSLGQLFGFKVWIRGFFAGLLNGHGVGTMKGDGFQMPGVFLLHRGRVLRSYVHDSAADRPDYEALAQA